MDARFVSGESKVKRNSGLGERSRFQNHGHLQLVLHRLEDSQHEEGEEEVGNLFDKIVYYHFFGDAKRAMENLGSQERRKLEEGKEIQDNTAYSKECPFVMENRPVFSLPEQGPCSCVLQFERGILSKIQTL